MAGHFCHTPFLHGHCYLASLVTAESRRAAPVIRGAFIMLFVRLEVEIETKASNFSDLRPSKTKQLRWGLAGSNCRAFFVAAFLVLPTGRSSMRCFCCLFVFFCHTNNCGRQSTHFVTSWAHGRTNLLSHRRKGQDRSYLSLNLLSAMLVSPTSLSRISYPLEIIVFFIPRFYVIAKPRPGFEVMIWVSHVNRGYPLNNSGDRSWIA